MGTKMKYQFGLCGAFDFDEKATGGQSVKTREFYYALCDEIGKDNVVILESTGYRKNPFIFLARFLRMFRKCEKVIVFPAQNGIKVFAPLCFFFSGKCKVYYSVIGGWLPKLAKENPKLKKYLSGFESILVETNVMRAQLANEGISNTYRLLNFKRLSPQNIIRETEIPLRLCYFSRVLEEKGIEDAIDAMKRINRDSCKCIFDIYGPVVDGYAERFNALMKEFPVNIRYKGVIDPSDSIKVIGEYDVQLFPTHYATEGIPGSIVDSYYAGVPVIASRWNSFSDVVIDKVTGIGFELGNAEELTECIEWAIDHPADILDMKRNCLEEAKKYSPHSVLSDLFKYME